MADTNRIEVLILCPKIMVAVSLTVLIFLVATIVIVLIRRNTF